MSITRFGIAAASLLAVLAACADSVRGESPGRYYVDFANGDDSNPGTVPDRPWKRAPGDPSATDRPRDARLRAGDHVIFAAGVVYRGEIKVEQSGEPGAPVTFEGAPGAPAIIDGSDPVSATPCTSAQQCGGLAQWRQLVRVVLDQPMPDNASLFSDQGLLRPARSPDPSDDFYRDEIDDMLPADPAELATGSLALPSPASETQLIFKNARVALWVRPNLVIERPITGIVGGRLQFDPSGVDFYQDRPGRYAVVGLTESLDRAGEYVVLSGGRELIARLQSGARRVSVARGRGGFELKSASHVVIRNLAFRNMSDGGDLMAGAAVLSRQPGNAGITVSHSRFTDMDMAKGQGPITLRGASDVEIFDNVIARITAGSGMRLSGPARNIVVKNNHISRIGRTGIMLMSLDDALVEGNVITDVRGVHGNGLSAYLDNHRVRFVHNTVLDAKQPATFHGKSDGGLGERNDIEFRENLFVAMPDSLGGLIAWGERTRGVRIVRNVMLGGRYGLRIPPGNSEIEVTENVGVKPVVFPNDPIDWHVADNQWFMSEPPAWASEIIDASRNAGSSISQSGRFDCRQVFGARKIKQIGAMIRCRKSASD